MNPLLKDNDAVETEDVDKYYFLFLAFKKRVDAKEREESGVPNALLTRQVV